MMTHSTVVTAPEPLCTTSNVVNAVVASNRQESLAIAGVLTVALVVRVWAVLTQTYVIHPDETYQYFEQAHRLAFGSGVVPWEYLEGVRSWLLPESSRD